MERPIDSVAKYYATELKVPNINWFAIEMHYRICTKDTYDMIKGNESHVGNTQFYFSNLNHLSILNATF